MVWSNTNQFEGSANGIMIEYGEVSFATTALTVEVTTYIGRLLCAVLTPKATTGGIGERLFCDRTITAGAVTVTREMDQIILGSALDSDTVVSNDYVDAAIGVCEVAGTLKEVWFYNTVQSGGTPLINLGHIATNGTGAADVDEFMADALAVATPGDAAGKTITTFTADAVGADDLITVQTTGGTTSDPTGAFVQVKIDPTPTSALTFNYIFYGFPA